MDAHSESNAAGTITITKDERDALRFPSYTTPEEIAIRLDDDHLGRVERLLDERGDSGTH